MAIISAFGADDNGSIPFKTTTTNYWEEHITLVKMGEILLK